MTETVLITFEDSRRSDLFQSLHLEGEETLLFAVEALVEKALAEDPYEPNWYPMGGRNAACITALRRAVEGTGWFPHATRNGLSGIKHAESGLFMAVHNTCERTGLESDKGHPRFASARSRSATKSLRDDLQGDLFDLVESVDPRVDPAESGSELNLHLCVYVLLETNDVGEQALIARAELIVGGVCSDVGFIRSKYRIPLNLNGLSSNGGGVTKELPPEDGAIEPFVSIRKRS